jgi:hypothetical protein
MSIPRPTLALNFAESPGILDPRASFVRATTGLVMDRMGVMRTIPAGMPRWRWAPTGGTPQGVLFEEQRTNLLLRSEELDNASHTKTSCSISANSIAAPDGATTADTITVSGAGGNGNQAVTITAGNALTLSWHFKQLASSHALLRISDGTNTVSAWFNLAAGTVGTGSAGAGTIVYSAHSMEALANGWYRCQLTVTTSTSTAITLRYSAAAADNAEPANTDSVYAWGGQAEQLGTTSAASSYIPTAGSTVTRNADSLIITTDSRWFSVTEGTLLLEWVGRVSRLAGVFAAVNNGFNDSIYLTRPTASQLQWVVNLGGVNQVSAVKSYSMTDGTLARTAIAWRANDFAWSLNGDVPTTDSAGTVPTGLTRIAIGGNWSVPTTGTANVPIRRALYWPYRLSNAALQTITE